QQEAVMLGIFGVALLAMSLGWLVSQRSSADAFAVTSADVHATYACQRCGRRVELALTLRAIRRTLLCPEHYHATYPGFARLQQRRPWPRREREWPVAVLIVGWLWLRERD
ncbi:MAG TPA: hypothetical protein VIU62_07440, partial [Chloroflexota bacterium]